jgi:hypothetical protein
MDKRVNIILINTQWYCAIERSGIDTDIINKSVDNSDNGDFQTEAHKQAQKKLMAIYKNNVNGIKRP